MAKRDDPSVPDHAFEQQQAHLTLVRDVLSGTGTLREKRTEYLPQAELEHPKDYDARLKRAVLFNGLKESVDGLTGMVYNEDPKLGDDVPDEIGRVWENLDNAGTHGDVLTKRAFRDALGTGHVGILVDFPMVGTSRVLSRAEERDMGLRPYWTVIPKEAVLSRRTALVNGRTMLTQLVLYERPWEPQGEFLEDRVERYRVYRWDPPALVSVQLYEKRRGPQGEQVVPLGPAVQIVNQTEIPFAASYANQPIEPLYTDPPLIDLAYLTVAHWQVQSDHLWAAYKASVPLLFGAGFPSDETISVGPNAAITATDTQASLSYVEHSGAALGATRQQLLDFKHEMSIQGLSMLFPETRSAETATAKRIDRSEQTSRLATAARGHQDALEQALGYTANFMGLDTGGSITINREFDDLSIDPQQAQVYSDMVLKGQLSLETLWRILQEGGNLPDDFDPELERTRVEADMGSQLFGGQGDNGGNDNGQGGAQAA